MSGIMRLLKLTDAPALQSFLKRVDADFPIPLSKKVNLSKYPQKVLSLGVCVSEIGENGSLNGAVLGYMNDFESRVAFLSVMAVDAMRRSEGLGSRLLARFEEEAILRGMRKIGLETHETNLGAIRFYTLNGYSIIEDLGNGQIYLEKRLDDGENLAGRTMSENKVFCPQESPGLSSDRPNILLTSVGRRAYLVKWFKDALDGSGEVHVVNSDPLSPAFRIADRAAVSPLIYSTEYIPFLIDYCKQNRIGAILSLFDIDIPVLAANKAMFEEIGCFLVVADPDAAAICNDKFETYMSLKRASMPAIPSFIDLQECERALDTGEVSFPLVLKPRWGMGSIGVEIVESIEELRIIYGMVHRKISGSYLKYESAVDPDKAVLIQAAIKGQEYGIDVINDLNGKFRSVVVRKKVAMRAGETDVAEVIPSDDRFIRLAQNLSEITHHPGNMDVDVFDADGELCILEMNVRFGGGYPFSHAAGVDLPKALVEWLRGGDAAELPLNPTSYGIFMKDISIVSIGESE